MIYNAAESLVLQATQCWACPVFDKLFQIISNTAGLAYRYLSMACIVVFCVILAIYIFNAVWNNIKSDSPDLWHTKSIQKVFINSIFALGLLATGVTFPKLITTITAEPVAYITSAYTQIITQTDPVSVAQNVPYTPEEMSDDGFFRPELRDAVINVMKTTIRVLQEFILMGVAVIDGAFEWEMFTGIGIFFKHIILFFVGLTLTWTFVKLFMKYCFYFADFIVAMAFFAFLFPLSLVLLPFKGADSVPGWLGKLGNNIGKKQITNMINSIVAMGSAVLTYTIIINILIRFMDIPVLNITELFAQDISDSITTSRESLTLMSCTALVFVLTYLEKQVPNVSKMILSAFNVKEENKLGEQLGDEAMKLADNTLKLIKNTGKTILGKNKAPDAPATKTK